MPDNLDKIVIGTSVTSGVVAGTGLGATVAGFGTGGIVAGSTAAGIQAGIGNVVAGSTFATLQSMGATGILTTMGTVGGVELAVAGVYGGYKLYKHYDPQSKVVKEIMNHSKNGILKGSGWVTDTGYVGYKYCKQGIEKNKDNIIKASVVGSTAVVALPGVMKDVGYKGYGLLKKVFAKL